MIIIALTLLCSGFAFAYLQECGKSMVLEAEVTRLKRALNKPDDSVVIEVDFRRH